MPASKDNEAVASVLPKNLRRDATPTIFADGLLGGSIEADVVRLELLARHFDIDSKSLSPAVVGRIVMPAEGFATFVAALAAIANKSAGSRKP
ncbi:hypothetical protein JQ543_21350 [Bradyrhizobium diazoefficiens]|nr:hypothetical protein [Bradyrhizobium diazoefficiens]MBR0850305.1 hypothetical protein [Bradyrhizobium diazoefficiens]